MMELYEDSLILTVYGNEYLSRVSEGYRFPLNLCYAKKFQTIFLSYEHKLLILVM